MKTITRLLLLAGLILTLAGCQTVDTRIAEKSNAFAALDPAAQARLKQGIVSVGDTPEMAYIALGPPDSKRVRETASGASEIWIYRDFSLYYPEPYFNGSYRHGYRYGPYTDPFMPGYEMNYWPFHGGRGGAWKEERIRLVFQEGKAVEVEQPKPRS